MDELTKLDPRYVTVSRISLAASALPILIAAFVLEGVDVLPFGVVIVPVLLIAAFVIIRIPLRRFEARGYSMSEDRLRVVRGLLFRSDTVVPFGRVQHLDVDQGPLERAFDLATLTVHTAGVHNASVRLPGLAHENAVAMREEIRAHIKRETV
ncbi:PH domain-containing protein [Erythrobacter sp. HKB08]|uniref:PH domain-containing protein n=1 Tax=Erythrobacter sp. HKB08 TaxID=2502843 RepID=UPI0010086D4E|nr:PH domain-containing protein [Erythrobacter sp. HKB08]